MYLNKATIIGNLTRDPEVKALPTGMTVASFSVATNAVYNTKDKERKEVTDYHNIVVFGRTADNCAMFLKKGSQVLVEGRLQTRSWESDGMKHYRTEIIADMVRFGTRSKGAAPTEKVENVIAVEPTSSAPMYPEDEINPEDIPF